LPTPQQYSEKRIPAAWTPTGWSLWEPKIQRAAKFNGIGKQSRDGRLASSQMTAELGFGDERWEPDGEEQIVEER